MSRKILVRVTALVCAAAVVGTTVYMLVNGLMTSRSIAAYEQQLADAGIVYDASAGEREPEDGTGQEEQETATGLLPRELVFYYPGMAPSEELEFKPVPFAELLPGKPSSWDTLSGAHA